MPGRANARSKEELLDCIVTSKLAGENDEIGKTEGEREIEKERCRPRETGRWFHEIHCFLQSEFGLLSRSFPR